MRLSQALTALLAALALSLAACGSSGGSTGSTAPSTGTYTLTACQQWPSRDSIEVDVNYDVTNTDVTAHDYQLDVRVTAQESKAVDITGLAPAFHKSGTVRIQVPVGSDGSQPVIKCSAVLIPQ